MNRMLLVIIVFASSLSALADSSVGCGLGSMVFRKNSIVSATFRATTNQLFSSQLFGITSGTSGCAQHSIVKRELYPVYYAEANLPELKFEMALGEGEYLATFAEVLGCDTEAQAAFMGWARQSYGQLIPASDTTPAELLQNLGRSFKATAISQGCDNLALI